MPCDVFLYLQMMKEGPGWSWSRGLSMCRWTLLLRLHRLLWYSEQLSHVKKTLLSEILHPKSRIDCVPLTSSKSMDIMDTQSVDKSQHKQLHSRTSITQSHNYSIPIVYFSSLDQHWKRSHPSFFRLCLGIKSNEKSAELLVLMEQRATKHFHFTERNNQIAPNLKICIFVLLKKINSKCVSNINE